MYFTVIFSVHCTLCVGLIGLVLLQQGKGADAGATFGGGGGSNTVLGTGGADFITKLTTALAIAFMVTSIMLVNAYTHMPSAGSGVVADPLAGSVMEDLAKSAPAIVEEATEAKAVPVEAEEADAEKPVASDAVEEAASGEAASENAAGESESDAATAAGSAVVTDAVAANGDVAASSSDKAEEAAPAAEKK